MFTGESSKFSKSWTFETQILKLAVCLLNIHNLKIKWSIVFIAGFFGNISEKDNYQYYQNTTKGFEFTDANFKIKAQFKIAKGDKWKKVSYSYLSCVHCTYSSGCTYLQSNMNITERDVELQKEKCQKLTISKGDNWESKNNSC